MTRSLGESIDVVERRFKKRDVRYVRWGSCLFMAYARGNRKARQEVELHMAEPIHEKSEDNSITVGPISTLREVFFTQEIPDSTKPRVVKEAAQLEVHAQLIKQGIITEPVLLVSVERPATPVTE